MESNSMLLVGNLLATMINIGWSVLEKRGDKTQSQMKELAKRVEDLDRDMIALQTSSDAALTHDDLSKVYETIKKTDEKLNTLIGENRTQSDTLRLIQNHIVHKGLSHD
ncbi:MAG: hypothetical protein RIR18_2460 [Pseudomonadota bacterium]|jgi:outer membrane murein-binding lipoprotein Lpp